MPFSQLSECVVCTQISVFIPHLQRYHHHLPPHSGLCSSSHVSPCEIISFISYFFKAWGQKNLPCSLFHSQHLVWALAYIKDDVSICRLINEYLFYLYEVLYVRGALYILFLLLYYLFLLFDFCAFSSRNVLSHSIVTIDLSKQVESFPIGSFLLPIPHM